MTDTTMVGATGPTTMTFDTFVVAPSNEFAHRVVRQFPSDDLPLAVLTGFCGVGKTHLLHAVEHLLFDRDARVRYESIPSTPSQERCQHVLTAIQSADSVLLLDDLHHFVGPRGFLFRTLSSSAFINVSRCCVRPTCNLRGCSCICLTRSALICVRV